MPFAYFFHTLALIKTLTSSDETIDELSEKINRFKTILKFMFLGPIYLLVSIPVNAFVFSYNIYTASNEVKEQNILNMFSKESLDHF